MRERGCGRFISVVVLRLFFAAMFGVLALASVATDAAAQSIDTLVVKLRDEAAFDPSAGLPASERSRLDAAIRAPFSHIGYTNDGALQLRLTQPSSIDAARAALNRARLLPEVLYANIVPPPLDVATRRIQAAAAGSDATAQVAAPDPRWVDRLIVKYRDATLSARAAGNGSLTTTDLAPLTARAGVPLTQERAMSGGAYVLRMFQPLPIDQARAVASQLAADPNVEYAEVDMPMKAQVVPNDPLYTSQWHYMSPPAENGGVNLPPAWGVTTGSAAIKVAVIDTGALKQHPDLAGRFVGGYDFVTDTRISNDGDGRDADASDPGDWVTQADLSNSIFSGCSVVNSSWHGSHVAGTIGAATNNASGVAGINWVSQIVPARVLGKCFGYTSDIADAIRWSAGLSVPGVPANANPVRVMNLSLGGGGTCDTTMQSAITAAVGANAVVVVAAGNSNADAASFSPANCNGVITVAATGRHGQHAAYSNWGSVVEISAPGGDGSSDGVLSTINAGATSPDQAGYTYAFYHGTSMATPHVAGIASLMLSVNPALTPSQVLSKLQTSARAFPTGTADDCTTARCGAGIVDAMAAVLAAGGVLASTTTLAGHPNPATVGADVTFTAIVMGSNATGSVIFTENGNPLSGCAAAVTLSGGGDTKTAACTTASLGLGTHNVVATYGGDVANAGSSSPAFAEIIDTSETSNVALASAGAVASASSTFSALYPVSSVIDNERAGVNWNNGGGWADATANVWPDWVQINFNGNKTINRVVLYTVQDNYANPIEPTDTLTFAQYGITDFTVQGWNGSTWVTLATVAGNNLIKRTVTFTAFTTDRIRVNVTHALFQYATITEIEAWGVAAASLPATTTTLTSSANPATVGSGVTFTVTVTGVSGSNPTGSVTFTEGSNPLSGCAAAVTLSGGGDTKTAACTTASLGLGTHNVVATYGGDVANAGSSSAALAQNITDVAGSSNVALASAGAVASASSTFSALYPVSSVIDNERAGVNWNNGGGWADATANVWPDWVQINFNGNKTINRVVLYTVQDNYANPIEPTDTLTFAQYGITDFTVQGWNGSTWVTLATVAGNNLIKRTVTFTAFTTDRIRVNVTHALFQYATITEIEAWGVAAASLPATTTTLTSSANPATVGSGVTFTVTVTGVSGSNPTGSVTFTEGSNPLSGCAAAVTLSGGGDTKTAACTTASLGLGTHNVVATYGGDVANAGSSSPAFAEIIDTSETSNVALASAGAVASASSTFSALYPVSSVIDNERAGVNWNNGGGWADATANVWPDWVQINFNGNKTINRVVLYTVQDNYANPIEPTDTLTFAQYGITDFTVQGWNGSTWVTLATVAGNNLIKRTVTFTAFTTDRIRVNVTHALFQYATITEIEAWGS